MTELKQIYRCNICNNMVEVIRAGAGELVCCGEPMQLVTEKFTDVGLEKHVPVIETVGTRVKVKVGSVPHPMEEKHHIEWVELIADNTILKQFLKPGDKPEAVFETSAKKLTAREYCNLHGLWSTK